ncbi:MAG: NUDIX domain-containing protein [Candidatus Paceibacterota bacterium]
MGKIIKENKIMEDEKSKSGFAIRVRAIVMNDGNLLVVKNSGNNFFALPGGNLDPGEDIKKCLEREIVEELGVSPDTGRLLYINNFTDKNGLSSIDFFFEVKNGKDFVNCEKLNRTHAHEIDSLVWASINDNIKIMPESFAKDFKVGKIISDVVRFIKD